MSKKTYESKIIVGKESLRVEVSYINVVLNRPEVLTFVATPGQALYAGVSQLPLIAPSVLPLLIKDLKEIRGVPLVDWTTARIEEVLSSYNPDALVYSALDNSFPEEFKLGIIGGSIDELVLQKISSEEKKCKDLIGTADGTDLGHCVFLGAKHGKDFLKRAKFYFVSEESDEHLERMREFQPHTVRIEFYGDKHG